MKRVISGLQEIVAYKDQPHIVIYENDLYEDYAPHWHHAAEFVFPVENDYTSTVNNENYCIHPNEILYIAPGSIHQHKSPEYGRRFFFLIDLSIISKIDGLSTILSLMGKSYLFSPQTAPDVYEQMKQIFDEILEEYFRSNDFAIPISLRREGQSAYHENNLSELAIYAKLLQLLTLLGRHRIQDVSFSVQGTSTQQKYISTFMDVCNYIEEHYAEDLKLDEVAELHAFSKFHFERLFKQFTGLPFYKYVNQLRIDHARELLTSPELSVTEIAINSGFSTPSAFIRMFKQHTGCTPSDYRKLNQSEGSPSGKPPIA